MHGYQERIQGADRVLRIRRIRKVVFAGLLALTVVLIAARLGGEGASLKPFFLPVNGILEVSLIMGLVASIISLYLRYLEIRNAQRDNQRFLMAKSSMTRSVLPACLPIGAAVALLLAITPIVAASLFADPLQVVRVNPSSTEVVSFTSPDSLGVTFVTQAVVSATAGNFSVAVVRNNVTLNTVLLTGPNQITVDIEPTMWAAYADWSIVFRNRDPVIGYVRFILQKGVVPTLFSTVPFLVFLYAATQVGWWVLLRPIRERTKESSRHAVRELEAGERFYDPSMSATDGAPMDTPAVTRKSFTSPPPPPPVRPEPPPPPSPAPVARAVKPEPPKPAPAPRPVVREPETADSLVKKAGGLVASGTYEGAPAAFEDALRWEPGNPPRDLSRKRELAAEDRRGSRGRAGTPEPRADRERERQLPAGARFVRRDPRSRAEQRERPDRQSGRVPPERETAGGVELPRSRAWRAARQRVRDPEPREHLARGRRPGRGARGVRSAHATLPERLGGVGGPGRSPRGNGAGRRRTAGVHGGAQGQPRQ